MIRKICHNYQSNKNHSHHLQTEVDSSILNGVGGRDAITTKLHKHLVTLVNRYKKAETDYHRISGETTGPDWFYLPRTKIDDNIKEEFRLLAKRELLEPGRYFKKPSTTEFPRYFTRAQEIHPDRIQVLDLCG
mmetsp:Transcript_7461/g.18155  ORF Transcript_7461/g.18155 Transcript_7461/m.18155 type:complete len:133 (+) Transcript_7461:793-1191(+)